jgi:Phage tail assembly chaperone protein
MTIYYSPITLGFYDTEVVEYPKLPDDCIEITAEERIAYINELNNNDNQLSVVDGKLALTAKEKIITWETIRLDRNDKLNSSDHTQIADYPGNKEAWSIYRQQLRDIPSTFSNPDEVIWPTQPK